jgi:hypothetical protein
MEDQKFKLGQVVATPGALSLFEPRFLGECLERHARGDWGELPEEDVLENEASLRHGFRLLSHYRYVGNAGESYDLWIITERDRSATTLLLPEEY